MRAEGGDDPVRGRQAGQVEHLGQRHGSQGQLLQQRRHRVTFRATTYTRPGRDKKASVTIEVVSGEGSLGSTVIQRIDAEEKKNARGSSLLYLPLDRVTGQASLDLRVSLEAVDD
ncbi:MAG: hypothetical protein AUH92_05940 [Acidobacteria bacterium 13_1_40CM_4_69_4]|nr:MAG: hypothetical protein AUH92_05940 [Acidobacteria bacterium 13_1_40CM_4_69_4]